PATAGSPPCSRTPRTAADCTPGRPSEASRPHETAEHPGAGADLRGRGRFRGADAAGPRRPGTLPADLRLADHAGAAGAVRGAAVLRGAAAALHERERGARAAPHRRP